MKILAIDATYKPHLKNKRHDRLDRALNPGGAYFSEYEKTVEYTETHAKNDDVSNSRTCQLS